MTISQQIQSQLEAYKNAGDAAGYYSTLAANGHDYGNLALEAATDTGFWGHYANNFLALVGRISYLRNPPNKKPTINDALYSWPLTA